VKGEVRKKTIKKITGQYFSVKIGGNMPDTMRNTLKYFIWEYL
jgi:hypothetical protein